MDSVALASGVQFEKIPAAFVEAYRQPLLDWAANFRTVGPVFELSLLRPPSESVLDLGFTEKATLACELREAGPGVVKVHIRPASGFDIEVIEQHTARLGKIRAARSAAARNWANRNVPVQAVFERIPDAFLRHYAKQFQTWGSEIKTRGLRCAVLLERPPGEAPPKDGEGRDILEGVWFEARVDFENPAKPVLIVAPADALAQELIEKHVRKMKPHWND